MPDESALVSRYHDDYALHLPAMKAIPADRVMRPNLDSKPPKSDRLTPPSSMLSFAPANKEATSDDEQTDGKPERGGVARAGGGMGAQR
jgi:hypothetical protein